MDLTLTDTQQMLSETCRDFLAKHASYDKLREMEASATGFDQELWDRIVEVGWTEIPFTEPGSADLGHLAVVLRELGRSALASPYFQSVVAAGLTTHLLGNTEAARSLVGRVSEGAMSGLAAPADPSQIARGVLDARTVTLTGGPYLVEWAHLADTLVCPVQLDDTSFLLVAIDPRADEGVAVEQCEAIDHERLGRVRLSDVVVSSERWLTADPLPLSELERVTALVRLFRAVEMSGGAVAALEITVDYVKTRHQFGRPLGSFQAVQHISADMAMESDGAFLSTMEAVCMAEVGAPFLDRAAIATFFAGRAYERVTQSAAQLHGGMGFMNEYHLQFYFRRAKAQRQRLGTTQFQLEFVARHVVDAIVATGSFPTRNLVVADG